MTYEQAIAAGKRQAKRKNETLYVVFEDGYHITDENELETFFNGLQPIAAIEPDGELSEA